MAKMFWRDRIGETLIIDEVTLTIVEVDIESKAILVEDSLTNDLHETTRTSWNNWKNKGVIPMFFKKIKPKKLTKLINGILFKVKECAGNKFKVVAEGFDGEHEMSKSTWRQGRFYKNAMKKLITRCRDLVLGKKARHENEREQFKQSNDLDAFRGCVTVKEVKNTYKRLAKLFHPDHGGSEEQFKKLQLRYETALIIAETLEGIMAEVNDLQ